MFSLSTLNGGHAQGDIACDVTDRGHNLVVREHVVVDLAPFLKCCLRLSLFHLSNRVSVSLPLNFGSILSQSCQFRISSGLIQA